ncbi:MAG: hypothetical protein DMG89_04540 [Acidobacteria bacterium]|nr:MAG: hypothetical protein DMG89_04540 [Acidobacteriota bacterium]
MAAGVSLATNKEDGKAAIINEHTALRVRIHICMIVACSFQIRQLHLWFPVLFRAACKQRFSTGTEVIGNNSPPQQKPA